MEWIPSKLIHWLRKSHRLHHMFFRNLKCFFLIICYRCINECGFKRLSILRARKTLVSRLLTRELHKLILSHLIFFIHEDIPIVLLIIDKTFIIELELLTSCTCRSSDHTCHHDLRLSWEQLILRIRWSDSILQIDYAFINLVYIQFLHALMMYLSFYIHANCAVWSSESIVFVSAFFRVFIRTRNFFPYDSWIGLIELILIWLVSAFSKYIGFVIWTFLFFFLKIFNCYHIFDLPLGRV